MKSVTEKSLKNIGKVIAGSVPTEQVYLFGSHAYGNPTADSDLDIYIVLKDDSGISQLDAIRMAGKALFPRRIPMDFLAMEKSDFEKRSKRITLENLVVDRGRLIYG
jgi:predicted nucleotidyltransferase